MLLWLRYRLAAVAPIQPLVWEPPYAVGVTPKSKKKKQKKKRQLDFIPSCRILVFRKQDKTKKIVIYMRRKTFLLNLRNSK